jgi:hypothetical protein
MTFVPSPDRYDRMPYNRCGQSGLRLPAISLGLWWNLGEWGSRKCLLASLDQSLRRMGLDYVDVFYSHRFDPHTPLEETTGADVAALERRDFDDDELAEIDRHATDSEINLWAASSQV